MPDAVWIFAAAFLMDVAVGDPVYRFHPVRLIGHLAGVLEKRCFASGGGGYFYGAVFWGATNAIVLAGYVGLQVGLAQFGVWSTAVLDVFVLYSSFALKDQYHHVRPIWQALEKGDVKSARASVQKIVGRDANRLDAHGVARAAVESIAESFVDGFFAPVFWFFTASLIAHRFGANASFYGVGAALLYRTVNTLDSMVGYKNERYRTFGCCSAKADDALGFVPARCSIIVLYFGALLGGFFAFKGLRTWFRDRNKTPSPNAGHAESFAAGALGVCLGGPVEYPFGIVEKPRLGSGTTAVSPSHIRSCWRLVYVAGWISVVCFSAVTVAFCRFCA